MQELGEGINLGNVPFVGITTLHYYWKLHKFLILENFLFGMNISETIDHIESMYQHRLILVNVMIPVT